MHDCCYLRASLENNLLSTVMHLCISLQHPSSAAVSSMLKLDQGMTGDATRLCPISVHRRHRYKASSAHTGLHISSLGTEKDCMTSPAHARAALSGGLSR